VITSISPLHLKGPLRLLNSKARAKYFIIYVVSENFNKRFYVSKKSRSKVIRADYT
jgi:hypothetical protein